MRKMQEFLLVSRESCIKLHFIIPKVTTKKLETRLNSKRRIKSYLCSRRRRKTRTRRGKKEEDEKKKKKKRRGKRKRRRRRMRRRWWRGR